MTYEFVELTNQAATAQWGWTIAFFLWFVGLAGMGLFVNIWVRSRKVFWVSGVAAIVGTLLVMSHLHRLLNLPFAVIDALIHWKFNFTSWMFVGICILAVLCVCVLFEAVCHLWWKAGSDFCDSAAMHWIMGALGVAATAYSGFLLTQAAGVPLWNTAVLPALWICSGLSCAMGLLDVLTHTGRIDHSRCPWLTMSSNIVDVGEAIVIFAFIQCALAATPGAVAGAHSLLNGNLSCMFWGGSIFMGIVFPIFVTFFKNNALRVLGGIAAMAGALCLRACVLFAGFFDPVIF